jgi:hypothetical protein
LLFEDAAFFIFSMVEVNPGGLNAHHVLVLGLVSSNAYLPLIALQQIVHEIALRILGNDIALFLSHEVSLLNCIVANVLLIFLACDHSYVLGGVKRGLLVVALIKRLASACG